MLLLETAARPLHGEDADAVAILVEATRARGIDVRTGVGVGAVDGEPGRARVVHFTEDGRERTLHVEAVAHAAGRIPALEGLDLAAAGVTFAGGVPLLTDAHRSRGNANIWVAGDAVAGKPQLSALATYEGRLVGRNLVRDEERAPDYRSIPSAVFAVPALASVGPTEEQARSRGLRFETKVSDMRAWRSARTHAEGAAWARVLIDRAADRVIAAHLVGHGAAETSNGFALAIRHGISVTDLRRASSLPNVPLGPEVSALTATRGAGRGPPLARLGVRSHFKRGGDARHRTDGKPARPRASMAAFSQGAGPHDVEHAAGDVPVLGPRSHQPLK